MWFVHSLASGYGQGVGVQSLAARLYAKQGGTMDWKRLDRARSSVGPVELDLIESYAQGKINRRDFVKRGTIIGLSVPVMGGIIAACGSDDATRSIC